MNARPLFTRVLVASLLIPLFGCPKPGDMSTPQTTRLRLNTGVGMGCTFDPWSPSYKVVVRLIGPNGQIGSTTVYRKPNNFSGNTVDIGTPSNGAASITVELSGWQSACCPAGTEPHFKWNSSYSQSALQYDVFPSFDYCG